MYFYLYVRLALGLVYTLPIPSHVYCRIIAKLGNPLRTSKRISGVTYLTVSPPAFQTFPSYYVSSFRQLSTQPSIGEFLFNLLTLLLSAFIFINTCF
ncbi:hypothetical protein JOB18_037204 [Solea senegalensis]|uniref:Secreted protein n=1 Tax=Solea senegalensis TaxID=28829 RepID=A0AAV6QRF8_SOLSE|nr:hypothetical protein JOB18_037204 [Solea senegalensis]